MELSQLAAIVVPAVALAGGVAAASLLKPPPFVTSLAQHLAAGAILASTATELVPDLVARSTIGTVTAFAIGTLLMLGLRAAARRVSTPEQDAQAGSIPTRLITVTGMDLFIDGLVLGAAFALGSAAGLILTAALTIELLFLGLASAGDLSKGPRRVAVIVAGALASAFVVGTVVGLTILGAAPEPVMTIVVGTGVVALMYLATEELLVEAHETAEREINVAVLFVGFLIILVLAELAR